MNFLLLYISLFCQIFSTVNYENFNFGKIWWCKVTCNFDEFHTSKLLQIWICQISKRDKFELRQFQSTQISICWNGASFESQLLLFIFCSLSQKDIFSHFSKISNFIFCNFFSWNQTHHHKYEDCHVRSKQLKGKLKDQ